MDDRRVGLIADIRCESCDGILVPPRMIGGPTVRKDAAFVCVRCSRPYYWQGEPPRLNTSAVVAKAGDE